MAAGDVGSTTIDPAVEAARNELWRRFVDHHGHILDYVGLDGEVLLPTPDDCALSRPNALSWGCPNEDGAMFGGLYLEAAIGRRRITEREEDREKARRIAEGLMTLASVGVTKGFIARGLASDGASHYALGSNDQTGPWLYGMRRYLQSDVPTDAERARVVEKVVEIVEVLERTGWQMPCDRPPFDFRGNFARWHFEGAPRLLWVLRMMHSLTGDARWERLYEEAIAEENPSGGPGRVEICTAGMVFEAIQGARHSWTGSCSVAPLRGLWELETDPELKEAYYQGLCHSAELARDSLPPAAQLDNEDTRHFECDWRVVNELWREQSSVDEAVEVAMSQLAMLGSVSPRLPYEASLVREPLFAAWIVTLCPEQELVDACAPAILQAIRHYRYDRLYMAGFFAAELAYYRLWQWDGSEEAVRRRERRRRSRDAGAGTARRGAEGHGGCAPGDGDEHDKKGTDDVSETILRCSRAVCGGTDQRDVGGAHHG